MDNGELLKECQRLRDLLRKMRLNPQPEPYHSIAVQFISNELSEIGRELLKHDRINGE